jgi:hypothetical protein
MITLLSFFLTLFASPFKPKSRLEAENAALRHQPIVLQRRVRGRIQLTNGDRWFFVQLYRWFPSVLKAITIIRPETVVRWHRPASAATGAGNHSLGSRPQIDAQLRALIRRMSGTIRCGERRASMASYSSSALWSLTPASRSTRSSDLARRPQDGAPFCVTTRQYRRHGSFRCSDNRL